MAIKQLIPNIFSFISALCGLFSVIYSFESSSVAAYLLVCAAFFDGIDGKTARFLGVSSSFGSTLDSLCDTVSFVVAPALLVYVQFVRGTEYALVGCVALTIFFMGGLYRLARFSVDSTEKTLLFQGMPTPNAAMFFVGLVIHRAWFVEHGMHALVSMPGIAVLLLLYAVLMVSHLPFASANAPRISFGSQIAALVVFLIVGVVNAYFFAVSTVLLLCFPFYRMIFCR